MRGLSNNVFQKHSYGLGGGLGGGPGSGGPMGSANPYQMNYNENRQGEQGSIGTSGSGDKPGSGIGGFKNIQANNIALPTVTSKGGNIGAISRGKGSSGGLASSGS